MDIAVDIRSLSEGRHSGVEEYTVQIIRAMLRVDKKNTFHLFHNSARAVKLPDFSDRAQVHAWRYPNKVFNLAQWASGYPRWDKLVKADCFFVPNFRITPLTSYTPLVTTVHDLSFDLFPEFFSWKRLLWHKMVNPRLLMENSDHLVSVSQATADNIVKFYGIQPEKISVIHSGVNTKKATLAQVKAVKKKYGLPDKFVLYFGVMEPRKNIPGLIDAWLSIADKVPHDLVIAGEKGWLQKDIKKSVNGLKHGNRIHWPGFVREADKAALYAAADLFVFPSFYEGFGFPPLEALTAGTPVVTSFNSSLPEIVGRWATLIDPYNVIELAFVMKEVLLKPQCISQEVQEEIRQEYSWDTAARQTLDVIERQV